MDKLGIFSRHIILLDYSYPMTGLLLIDGEVFFDIKVFSSDVLFFELENMFPDYSLIDYSDFYLSPGIVDINARVEWEEFSTFTKAAISGGVTFALIESSHFENTKSTEEAYCDFGFTKIVNEENYLFSSEDYFALKLYLFPPSSAVKSLKDPTIISQVVKNATCPVFVDPNCPEQRMLFITSPHRHESLEVHVHHSAQFKSNIFAAAYGEPEKQDSSSDDEDPPKRVSSLNNEIIDDFMEEATIFRSFDHSIGGDEVIQSPDSKESEDLSPNRLRNKRIHLAMHSATIYDDLNRKITERTQAIEALCNVEEHSYKYRGNGNFSSYIQTAEAIKTEESIPQSRSINRRRPSKINTIMSDEDRNQEYSYFLANCPEHWETKGIDFVLRLIKPYANVHFQGISSAAAINKIRQQQEHFKHITCEIPASHLFFSSNSIKNKDTRFKSSPPIRNAGNFNLLWDLVKLRCVNAITSGHVYIEKEFKIIDSGNFQNALKGICSMGATLQCVWTSLNIPVTNHEKLENYLVRMSKWMSMQPCRIIGCENRGSITRGKLADLVIWNPYEKKKIKLQKEYKSVSPFSGLEMFGKVHAVFLRGKIAYLDGKTQTPRGRCFINNLHNR